MSSLKLTAGATYEIRLELEINNKMTPEAYLGLVVKV